MEGLPLDLIVEILVLLPVVSLLRFRAVSKQWRALIESTAFGISHLEHHQSKKSIPKIVSFRCQYADYIDFDSLRDPEPLGYPRPAYKNFRLYQVLAPCNGLLCVATVRHGAFLWNPFTGKQLIVPNPPTRPPYSTPGFSYHWSIGYDSLLDDYKLVFVWRLKYDNGGLGRSVVWVYSVKLGFWKNLGDMPYFLENCTPDGIFGSGALHWKGQPRAIGDPEFIIALDLHKLEYNLVHLPECLEDHTTKKDTARNKGWRFGVFNGSLYALPFVYVSKEFELWVMKEYGVQESWTRLITSTAYSKIILRPLAYVENGNKLLFVDSSNLLAEYDFGAKTFKVVVIPDFGLKGTPYAYAPSLLFPSRARVCANK